MSSSFDREPLTGIIRHKDKIVGGIALPESETLEFIEEFNHCYGPAQMHIDPPAFIPAIVRSQFPVGACRDLRKKPWASDNSGTPLPSDPPPSPQSPPGGE